MGAAREKDQADFDLERFIDMFDTAMTSEDPRVIETLRSLMMIVTLTRPETTDPLTAKRGPLRRAFEDMNSLWRRFEQMEEELRQMHQRISRESGKWPQAEGYHASDYNKYTMTAAAKMAQDIDADVMRQISTDWAKQLNGGKWPKGKL